MRTELVLLFIASHLAGVLPTPVDLTNRTDVGGLVQDQRIDLDWLGTLLKGFGPVLVPQPTPFRESLLADDSQSESRADADVGDGSQSESRADADAGELPEEETHIRKPLSVDSDFLEALLSSEDGHATDDGWSSGPLSSDISTRVEEEPSVGATENFAAEIEGLVAPSTIVTHASGGEKVPQSGLQNSRTENAKELSSTTESSGGKIQESVTATPPQDRQHSADNSDEENKDAETDSSNSVDGNDEEDPAKGNAEEDRDTESDNAIDESDEQELVTESPVIPSWYNSEEYGDDLYPYTGEDPWESWGWPVLPTEAPDTTPEQIHISWGNLSSQMVVMWSTKSHGTGRVQYGIAPGNYSQEVAAEYSYFWYGNNEGLKHVYRAVLTDLLPNRTYSYKVLSGEEESPGFQFTAKRDDLDWSPALLVYGDMGRVGGAPSLARLTREAKTGTYAAVLHVGDFAYDLHTQGGKYGDDFMNRIQDIATKLPYMTCPGNHEIEFDFNPYLTRFSMPQSPWPGNMDKMWYSFDLGRAHFISYSSEVYFTSSPEEEQYRWLLQDLTEANSAENRTLHPWIIAFGHRPMYCSNVDGDDCTTAKSRVRAGLEDLFYQQGVDIIIEAHEHSYERLWPVYNYTLVGTDYRDPRAPVHIISGAAGCNEFDGVCINPMMGPKGPWSAFRAWIPGMYGYGRLRVHNSTHVHWEQVLAVNGQVIDSAWIVQHHHRPFGEE